MNSTCHDAERFFSERECIHRCAVTLFLEDRSVTLTQALDTARAIWSRATSHDDNKLPQG